MKYVRYIFLYLFTTTFYTIATDFLYPVACCSKSTRALLMKQQSNGSIQLLLWDYATDTIQDALWSVFKPAGIQLLPEETGFSFIDNGRLRIKYFNKRSAKTVDFDHYFYMINCVHWINQYEFYCSAKESDYYALFHCSVDGYSHCIASFDNSNCSYPQKIGSDLFYIEEHYSKGDLNNPTYCIRHIAYPRDIHDNNTLQNNASNAIIDFNNRPIIFLNMASKTEGFVIEHTRNIANKDEKSSFYYHTITYEAKTWQSRMLFSFDIPTSLFAPGSSDCLYESLLPLIPRLIDSKIYFVDCAHNQQNHLESYFYDLQSSNVVKNSNIQNNFFVPLVAKRSLMAGGILKTIHSLAIIDF